jgi:hypothetical protein
LFGNVIPIILGLALIILAIAMERRHRYRTHI